MKKTILTLFLTLLMSFIIQNTAAASQIKFIQVTDVHYSYNSSYGNDVLTKTVEDINKQKDISFVVFSGDNIDKPNPLSLSGFLKIINGLKIPYYIVIGNHDVFKSQGLSKQKYIEQIKDQNFFYKPSKPSYVFKKNGFVFIVVDGSKEVMPGAVGYFRKDTLDWLEKQLVKYEKFPIVLVQHYPLVEPKVLKSHETFQKEEYLKRIDKYNNIVAVISGHYHINGENMRNGVYHISTPTLMNPPNCYKVIEISTTKGFSPMIYTELKEVNPQ